MCMYSMEDRHNLIANLAEEENLLSQNVKKWLEKTSTTLSFFGVYDGHSGTLRVFFFFLALLPNPLFDLNLVVSPTAHFLTFILTFQCIIRRLMCRLPVQEPRQDCDE